MPIRTVIRPGGPNKLPVLLMLTNNLTPPKHLRVQTREHMDIMAQPPQPLDDTLVDALFDVDLVVNGLALLLAPGRLDANPRRVERTLRIHAKHEHVEQHLHVALRLHEPAHDAIARVQAAVAGVCEHGGDDGVVRALPGREDVGGVGRVQREVGAAVLQGEAAAARDNGRAEAAVVADYEGAGVAFGVAGAEVDGVRGAEGG